MPNNLRDDNVIIIVIVICLVTPVGLVIWWTTNDFNFPPMIVAILLGISTAALTYRYLGGTDGAGLSVGALKLFGSGAMLLGTTLVTNSYLADQMNPDTKPLRLSELRRQAAEKSESIERLNKENRELKEKIAEKVRTDEDALLDRVRNIQPGSDIGRRIQEIFKQEQGPFAEVKRKLKLRTTIADKPRDVDSFFACDRANLRNERARFSSIRKIGGDAALETVEATYQGKIASAQCDDSTFLFDVQLSCAAGAKLFPDKISGCNSTNAAQWIDPKATRTFEVSVEVLNVP